MLGLIANCRTGRLGYLQSSCRDCGHSQIMAQSCGNRHCPLCLGPRQARWAAKVSRSLPEVAHFHVVFTLPGELELVVRRNREVLLNGLMEAVAETMKTFMRNNWKCAGGFGAVLHTWGQTLNWHPHVHLLVPGGGFRLDGGGWKACRNNYLFSVRALSEVFRAIYLRRLREADAAGKLTWPLSHRSRTSRDHLTRTLSHKDWVVFARPTLRHTRSVVRYLARYTSRIGISNRRLMDLDERKRVLTFQYIDYRNGGRRRRTMTLPVGHFLLRFAQHILPRGLVRVRWFGFLSSASRFRGNHPLPHRMDLDEDHDDACTARACSCGHSNWTTPVRIPYVYSADETLRKDSWKAFPLSAPPRLTRSPTSR